MAQPSDITPANFWDHVPQPDFDMLWNLQPNEWFVTMSQGWLGVLQRLVQENWATIEAALFFTFALILVPAIIRRVRWGPRGTEDANGQGRWNI